jgi:transcriptional regulator with XRE-family HTH domain
MSLQSKEGLRKKLGNKQFRDAFVASRIAQTIAFQLRVLRQREGLSQDELAKELGTSQNAVSRMESTDYGKHSVSTLRKAASYFDVGLIVRFAPISEIAGWTMNLTGREVEIPTFENDTGLIDRIPAASAFPERVAAQATGTAPSATASTVIQGVLGTSRSTGDGSGEVQIEKSNNVISISDARAQERIYAGPR